LPEPVGSEPSYRRPILIMQSDDFNHSQISTIISVVITSNIKLNRAPSNIFLPKKSTGLSKDSVANVSQVVTVDKRLVSEKIGVLSSRVVEQVEKGICLILEL